MASDFCDAVMRQVSSTRSYRRGSAHWHFAQVSGAFRVLREHARTQHALKGALVRIAVSARKRCKEQIAAEYVVV